MHVKPIESREWKEEYECDSPSRLGDDHLSAQFIEFVPKILVLEVAVNSREFLAVTSALQEFGVRIGSWSWWRRLLRSSICLVIGISIRGSLRVPSRSTLAMMIEIRSWFGSDFRGTWRRTGIVLTIVIVHRHVKNGRMTSLLPVIFGCFVHLLFLCLLGSWRWRIFDVGWRWQSSLVVGFERRTRRTAISLKGVCRRKRRRLSAIVYDVCCLSHFSRKFQERKLRDSKWVTNEVTNMR